MPLNEKSTISTLYVHRPLINAEDLLGWAAQQGFKSTLHPQDMHVTIAFSKRPVPWHRLPPILEHLHVDDDGNRMVNPLGDKGAVVLHFQHPHLHERWQQILDQGASWDHNGYKPHITITYDGSGVPLHRVMPYNGSLIFGPEQFAPLDDNWNEKIREIPLIMEKRAISTGKTIGSVKYGKSIMENNRMTELSTLLMKNIDLILEAYNIDDKGNLVVANKRRVAEADEVFHNYFVKSMNQMFRRLNEADPIMHQPDTMGMAPHGHDDLGIGSEQFGDMSPMGAPHEMDAPGRHPGMGGPHMHGMGEPEMGFTGDGYDEDMMGEPPMDSPHAAHMGGPHGMTGGHGGTSMESAQGGEYDWLFNEDVEDTDIDAMFEIAEDEDTLNEFGGMHDDQFGDDMGDGMGGGMGGGMGDDMMGGHNDFGGDMGGMAGGSDDMMGGGMGMGGDAEMVTIHGETDSGSPFEFSFDPSTLGFGGDDMGSGEHEFGGGDGGDDFGGEHDHESHEDHGDFGGSDEAEESDEDKEPPVAEAAFHNGKPRKTGGRKAGRMAVVPADPATGHAAPFPTPQGTKQKH